MEFLSSADQNRRLPYYHDQVTYKLSDQYTGSIALSLENQRSSMIVIYSIS